MKKKVISLLMLMLFVVSSLVLFNFSDLSAKEIVTGHMVYDYTDQVWRCLGSAYNCDF